jgi:hypothetical protein
LSIWQELAIEPCRDVQVIKLAYAARLKQVHPEDDPEGFQRLRAAYERALAYATHTTARPARTTVEHPGTPRTQPDSRPTASTRVEAKAGDSTPRPVMPHAPDIRQAVDGLIKLIMSAPPPQRGGALAAALKQPGWEGLDFQAQLQRAIAATLLAHFEQLQPLVGTFAQCYGWTFKNVVVEEANRVIAELMARSDARDWRLDIEAEASDRNEALGQSLKMLQAPADVPAFYKFSDSGRNLKAMSLLLERLHGAGPHVLHFEINAPSVQWWTDYLASKRKAARKTGFSVSGSWIFRILWIVLVLSGSLGRCTSALLNNTANTTSDNSPPSSQSYFGQPRQADTQTSGTQTSLSHYKPGSTPAIDAVMSHAEVPSTASKIKDLGAPLHSTAEPGALNGNSPWPWKAVLSYDTGDLVKYEGQVWQATGPSQGQRPDESPMVWTRQ